MFDVSFSELALVGIVALVVIGPERLPKVARTAGHLFGRLQRYVANVKADINREIDASELSKVKQEVTEAARAFEQSVQQQAQAFESEARAIEQAAGSGPGVASPSGSADPALASPVTPDAAASAVSAATGATTDITIPFAMAPAASPSFPTSLLPPATAADSRPGEAYQAALDFGIEPLRAAATPRA